MPAPLVRGTCLALFAHDLALAVDLDHAERILAPRAESTEQREFIRHSRRGPSYVQFKPPPLRITSACEPFPIDEWKTAAQVDAVVYDFGAASITYTIPFECPLDALVGLSSSLYDHPVLTADARKRAQRVLDAITPAVRKPALSPFVEDYYLFHIDPASIVAPDAAPADLSAFIARHNATLAQILRSEPGPLSPQQIDEALVSHTSYGPRDAAVIDWNAAILLDPDPQDAHLALEFANVELLEMRHLDDRLDAALEEAYQVLSRDAAPIPRSWRLRPFTRQFSSDLRRVSELQMESALLFEGVNNALKLLGDQYLARIYRLAAQRLHLPDWDASILRKLATLEGIYQRLSDRQTNRRMETLEWIIIALIAFEIAMSILDRVRG